MLENSTVPPTANFLKALLKRMLPESALLAIRRRRSIKWVKLHEPSELALIRLLANPGDTVVDLGANIGYFTKCLSRIVGASGRVYCVEPIPHSFRMLQYTIEQLRLTNVSAFQCAVSGACGNGEMVVPRTSEGDDDYYEAFVVTPGSTKKARGKFVDVEFRTLDDLLAERAKLVSFVKCDIEGHELDCLRGARIVLAEAKPSWYMEVKGDPDDTSGAGYAVFEEMKQAGYEAFCFQNGELGRRRRGDRSENYFFLRPEHVAKLLKLQNEEVRIVDHRNEE